MFCCGAATPSGRNEAGCVAPCCRYVVSGLGPAHIVLSFNAALAALKDTLRCPGAFCCKSCRDICRRSELDLLKHIDSPETRALRPAVQCVQIENCQKENQLTCNPSVCFRSSSRPPGVSSGNSRRHPLCAGLRGLLCVRFHAGVLLINPGNLLALDIRFPAPATVFRLPDCPGSPWYGRKKFPFCAFWNPCAQTF